MSSRGTITQDQISTNSKLGGGAALVTYSGGSAPIAGNLPKFAFDGSLIDSGGGSGGGGAGSLNQSLQVNGIAVSDDYEWFVNRAKPILVNGV